MAWKRTEEQAPLAILHALGGSRGWRLNRTLWYHLFTNFPGIQTPPAKEDNREREGREAFARPDLEGRLRCGPSIQAVKMISTLPEAPRYHWARLVPDGHHALAETEPEKADEADKEQN